MRAVTRELFGENLEAFEVTGAEPSKVLREVARQLKRKGDPPLIALNISFDMEENNYYANVIISVSPSVSELIVEFVMSQEPDSEVR
jgi:ubiquinone/menaquinone biosynthesis C-methylase UbiE